MAVDPRLLVLPIGLVLLVGCAHETAPTSAVRQPGPPPTASPPAVAPPGQPLGAFEVTCHTGPGTTATGRPNGPGVVAVDPAVIPLGTSLQVERVGRLTAADRGGAVDGRSLDVWLPSADQCVDFGRQQLKVWRLPA